MLSLIQLDRQKENFALAPIPADKKTELQLLDVIATLAVRRNDVVAAVGKLDGLGNVQGRCICHCNLPERSGPILQVSSRA